MLARVATFAIDGIDPRQVWVEVDIRSGLPAFTIVGLGDAAVRESRDRVRSAIPNSGFEFPQTRITANLAPAFLRKVGPGFDAALALGVLAASGQVPADALAAYAVFGELSLSGELRDSPGALAVAEGARRAGLERLIVPRERAREAALVEGLAGRRGVDAAGGGGRARRGATLPALPAPAHARGRLAGRARSRGHSRARRAAAGARDRRRRRPQPAARGRAGNRQDDARPPDPLDPAGDDAGRGDRGDADPQHRRAARGRPGAGAPVPRSAPHDLAGGAGRRERAAAAGRGDPRPPRGAVPRRARRVPALEPRRSATAARGRVRDDRARPARARVPDAVHAGRRHQPVPVRVRRRRRPVPVRRRRPPAPQPAAQRTAARPDGPADQRRAAHRGRPARRAPHLLGAGAGARRPRSRAPAVPPGGLRGAVQRRDGRAARRAGTYGSTRRPSRRWPRRTRSGRSARAAATGSCASPRRSPTSRLTIGSRTPTC